MPEIHIFLPARLSTTLFNRLFTRPTSSGRTYIPTLTSPHTTMDCFNNTCLSCDRECEGHYCSQSCKLADVERAANTSVSSSPTSPTLLTRPRHLPYAHKTPGYVLSPAYHFSQKSPASDSRRPNSSYFSANSSTHSSEQTPYRVLTPSSSRSSLVSTSSSHHSQGGISAQDTQQLQDYFSSFEKARAAKRRSSTR